ncbi:MAG: HipA domain-containing protein [Candidatus Berkiella sp.]
MSHCPITYELLLKGEKYSKQGLKLLSPKLTTLNDLHFSAKELQVEALARADKMSIQGVQPKLSAVLDIKDESFALVDNGGLYILKPQSALYEQAPENEDLTMRMAKALGIEVPLHGLVYSKDQSLTYFIKRFDRGPRKQKIAMEDFAQLAGLDRETKYSYSMEKLAHIIERYTTFPAIEKAELFIRVLFNYLIGNEDMHLKNYALLTRDGKTSLAPAYDFINSTIAIKNPKEEIALTLNGRKRNLRRKDFIEYYGLEILKLNKAIIDDQLERLKQAKHEWFELIDKSFLTSTLKQNYENILQNRLTNLF